MAFVHLHAHTDASDGVGTLDRLVAAAVTNHQTALAITDHGTLANMVAFFLACVDAGIKPIFGQEIYLALPGKEGEEARIHHMTVLVQNKVGLSNMYRLTTLGAQSPFKKPAVTLEALLEHNEGLILLSGCSASPIYHLEGLELKMFVNSLRHAFGDRFYLEITLVPGVDTASRVQRLREEMGLEAVVTCDVHYADRDNGPIHNLMTGVRFGYRYESEGLWLKSGAEVSFAMKTLGLTDISLFDNSGVIADRCEFIDIRSAPSLPHVEGAEAVLKSTIMAKLKELRKTFSVAEMRVRLDRVAYELCVIREMGYVDYFFIVADIVDWAKKHGVRVGPGRGSGAGSYLLFLLGVTSVDPIEFGLSFERFLNPKRRDMPDVDIDFSMETRDQVLSYTETRWHGVPIATYSHYAHKMLVHDIAKAIGIPREIELKAAEDQEGDTFEELMRTNPLFARTYELALGQIRHRGKHASGFVITQQDVPLERAGDKLVVPWTEGEQKELSKVGVVKFDLLGLSAISALEQMESISGKVPDAFGSDDETLALFRRGDLLGIFQFSGSQGIRKLTMAVAPTSGEDLIAINALYRPGALDVGSATAFPEWKKKPRKVHPKLDPILERTFGAVVYQEQVMAIVAEVMGGDLGDADLARRLIVKSKIGDESWERQIAELRASFLKNGCERGFDKAFLVKLWVELISHARYSFNRAHAACYAHISYSMAWYKVHAPIAFYAAMLVFDPDSEASFLYEAVSRGIKVMPPHVNNSSLAYEVMGDTINLPIGIVKFLGETGASKLLLARKTGGPFYSFEDFNARVSKREVNSRARMSLFASGAMNELAGNPASAGIKADELFMEIGSKDAQREFLGFTIPTTKMIEQIDELRAKADKRSIAGIVASIVEKKKAHGVIWSCYLYPDGFFWCPEKPSFVKGDAVIASLAGVKATKVKRL